MRHRPPLRCHLQQVSALAVIEQTLVKAFATVENQPSFDK